MIPTSVKRDTWSHVTLLRFARHGEKSSEEHSCTRWSSLKKERRSEMSRGLKKWDRSNNRRARASVAINSMLTTIISEGSNEAAGRRRNRVPSSSLSPHHRFVRSCIYLRNYRYDDYDRARPRSVEYSPPRGNAIVSVSLSFSFTVSSSALSLYSATWKFNCLKFATIEISHVDPPARAP